jgi:hypothetical protein
MDAIEKFAIGSTPFEIDNIAGNTLTGDIKSIKDGLSHLPANQQAEVLALIQQRFNEAEEVQADKPIERN